MDINPHPSAQQILGSIVRAMRLSSKLSPKLSKTTRKTFDKGERVSNGTRHEYVTELAALLVELGFPVPLDQVHEVRPDHLREFVAGGIGTYALMWDRCQSYFGSYGPRDSDPLLTCLPMLRLALQDLAVRLCLLGIHRHHKHVSALVEHGPSALTEKRAFLCFLRFQMNLSDIRRTDIVGVGIGESTFEEWEAGALPQSASLESLACFLENEPQKQKTLELELRIVVALDELWRWLADVGLPDSHRRELATSFLTWMAHYGLGFVQGHEGNDQEKETARINGIVCGAREPSIGHGVAGLSRMASDHGVRVDFHALGGKWNPAIKRWYGFLNLETGSEDTRRDYPELPEDWTDREIVAWGFVSFRLLSDPSGVKRTVVDNDCVKAEGLGATARQAGDPVTAERILKDAITLDPTEPWLHIELAQALEYQFRLPEALQAVDEAISRDPEIFDAHMLRSRILFTAHHGDEALVSLATAGAMRPGDPVVDEWCGYAYKVLGRRGDALTAFRRSRRKSPQHSPAWENEAKLLLEEGDYTGAMRAAKEAEYLGGTSLIALVQDAKKKVGRK